jgi:hypothetical protein
MNNALIAIGGYRSKLTDKAIAAARRIERSKVDHGATACKTPEAIPYIQKVLARQKKVATDEHGCTQIRTETPPLPRQGCGIGQTDGVILNLCPSVPHLWQKFPRG